SSLFSFSFLFSLPVPKGTGREQKQNKREKTGSDQAKYGTVSHCETLSHNERRRRNNDNALCQLQPDQHAPGMSPTLAIWSDPETRRRSPGGRRGSRT